MMAGSSPAMTQEGRAPEPCMRNDGTLDRRKVASVLLRDPGDLLVVTGLGAPSYDVAAAGDRPLNFYLWGAMGGAAMIGLGIALAQPRAARAGADRRRRDAHGMGSLATIAAADAPNLAIAVLDNARYGETGSQPSHTGLTTDLAAVASACGWVEYNDRPRHGRSGGTAHLGCGRNICSRCLRICTGQPPRHLPPRDGAFLETASADTRRRRGSTHVSMCFRRLGFGQRRDLMLAVRDNFKENAKIGSGAVLDEMGHATGASGDLSATWT